MKNNLDTATLDVLLQNLVEAQSPEGFAAAKARILAFMDGWVEAKKFQAVEAFKAAHHKAGYAVVMADTLDLVERQHNFSVDRHEVFEGAEFTEADPAFFTLRDEGLNDLLNNTAFMLMGRGGHDLGMMWLDSLEAVLERLNIADAADVEEEDADLSRLSALNEDVDGRLVKLLVDQVESNKFELLLGGMNFATLCDDGEPSLLVLTHHIEEEFGISFDEMDDIGEETLESLNQLIVQKRSEASDPKIAVAEIEARVLMVLTPLLSTASPYPIDEKVGDYLGDDLLRSEFVGDMEREFGVDFDWETIWELTFPQLYQHIKEVLSDE